MLDWADYVRQNLRLGALRPARESEIIEDIAQQLEDVYQEGLDSGLSESEAADRARDHIPDWKAFSNQLAAKADGRMSHIDRWAEAECDDEPRLGFRFRVNGLWQDAVYGWRTLRSRPAFALLAIVILGLGIGATVTSFGILYAGCWRPLPFVRGNELISVFQTNVGAGVVQGAVSPADFYDWESQSHCFSGMAAYAKWPFNLTGTREPERLDGVLVSPDFFNVLRVQPASGRTFRSDEDEEGKSSVAVVSRRLWQRVFGQAELAEQTITLNGTRMVVIGILPASFSFPNKEADVWVPLALNAKNRQNREGKWLGVIARLRTGTTISAAQKETDVVARRLEQVYPTYNTGWRTRLASLHDTLFGRLKKPLLLVQAAMALLFLAACFNIAGLTLARYMERAPEIATRAALGATRWRIVRQLVVESTMCALPAAALGLALSFWTAEVLRTVVVEIVPALESVPINSTAVSLAALLSLISILICGLVPALRSTRGMLRSRSGVPARTSHFRQVLVVSQIALAAVLAIGSMLLVASFRRLMVVDPGFNPRNAVAVDLTLSKAKYRNDQQQVAFLTEVLGRVRSLPGVEHAGAVSDLPLRQNSMTFRVVREEDLTLRSERLPKAGVRWVTAGYFAAMQLPLLAGRLLDEHDTAKALPVAMVNEAMAHQLWPHSESLGKRIRLEEDARWFSVVGIVRNVKQIALSEDEVPALYLSYAQKSQEWLNWATLVVRSSTPPDQLVAAIRTQVHGADKDQPLSKIALLEQYVDSELVVPRLASVASSVFSILALLLALSGVSAVVAFSVAQRTHEIGVRLALGARPRHILQLAMAEATKAAIIGLGIAFVAATGLVRLLHTLLYGVRTMEPLLLVQGTAVCALLILLSSLIPAKRALHIDPLQALRHE